MKNQYMVLLLIFFILYSFGFAEDCPDRKKLMESAPGTSYHATEIGIIGSQSFQFKTILDKENYSDTFYSEVGYQTCDGDLHYYSWIGLDYGEAGSSDDWFRLRTYNLNNSLIATRWVKFLTNVCTDGPRDFSMNSSLSDVEVYCTGAGVQSNYYRTSQPAGWAPFDPPPTPTNFQVSTQNYNPKLTWNAVTVPDLDGYEVYRSLNGTSYSKIATVSKTATSYIDDDISTYGKSTNRAYYKIRAFDRTNKYSAFTYVRSLLYTTILYKTDDDGENDSALKETIDEKIQSTRFTSVSTNPSNPNITINYSIANASNVNIEIYDLVGRKVAELTNREHSEGKYSITWNTNSDISSGIYLAVLHSGDTVDKTKITLLK